MRTTLYRFFDAQDRLLYVGIAGRPAGRAHQHSKEKEWWVEVTHSTYEHFDTREAAAAAEVAAIVTEHPVYNVVHNGPNVKMPNRVRFRCRSCGLDIADGSGYVQVDQRSAFRLDDGGIGEAPQWYPLHSACDPDLYGEQYWMAVERLRTNRDLVEFEAHILQKRWGTQTDICQFVEEHLIDGAIPQPTGRFR